MTDAEFEIALEQGLEPRDHLANLRVAWLMCTRYGPDLGLRETARAIRRRAERMGSGWDPELTRCWFERVAAVGPTTGTGFERFLAEHPQLLGRARRGAELEQRVRATAR